MTATDGRVLVAAYRAPYFGRYAGYERVADYLTARCDACLLPERRQVAIPRRLTSAVRLPVFRLHPAWGHVELEVLRRTKRDVYGLVHFVYGDVIAPRTLHTLARRRAVTIGTMHAVADRLEWMAIHGPLRHTVPMFERVLTICTPQRDVLAACFPDVRVDYVPHGVDCAYFRPSFGIERSRPTFVSVGMAYRDFALLKAVARQARTDLPDVRFIVWAAERPVGEWPPTVRFLTRRLADHELRSLYQQATASLFLVETATAHNAVVESLACGAPVIATDCRANRDYVDASTGWLVGRTADSVIAAMSEALVEGSASQRGHAARRWAEQLDWARIAARYEAIYSDALSS